MDLSENQIYRFGEAEVDLSRNCLLLNGEEKHLRQKAFQVLVYLLKNKERLVSKNELFENIWEETAVTEDVLVQCIKEIRRVLEDSPNQPRFIKTVPKLGYRFIAKLENHESLIKKFEAETEEFIENPLQLKAQNLNSFFQKYRFLLITLLLIILLLPLTIYYLGQSNAAKTEVVLPIIEGKKTIAVMFFENKSATPQFNWLQEGLTDMLITDLSRSEKLTVLSRAGLYNFLETRSSKNLTLDEYFEIAQKVQAEFIITGSFGNIGERLRFDIQLFDVQTKNLLTTESLIVEKPEQILSEVDLLSLKITNKLEASPAEKPNLASVMTNNLEAYRFYSLALEKANGLQAKDGLQLLEKAVTLDPEFAMAHARIGYIYTVTLGWAAKGKPHLEKAYSLSNRLTEKDRLYIQAWYAVANSDFTSSINTYQEILKKYPTETEAYLRLALLLRGEEKFEEAILVLRQGLNVDPNSPNLHNSLGGTFSIQGKHSEAISEHLQYVALRPNEPNAYDSLGLTYHWAGQYEKAIEEFNKALKLNPNFEIALIHLGNTYFQSGRYYLAIDCFKKYIAAAPSKLERARGYSTLAYVYRKQRKLAESFEAAKQAAKEEETSITELFISAVNKSDWTTAENLKVSILTDSGYSNRGARFSPRYKFYLIGYLALKKGENEVALENFKLALSHPPFPWSIDSYEDCLANAYLETGDYDKAIAEYQRILQLNPNYPLARFSLALALEKKGLIEESKQNYQIFLKSWELADQNLPEIIQAKQSLK